MNEADLTVHGLAAWLRLLAGLGLFLLPGVAAADRFLKGTPMRFVWAPLFSFTLLVLAAILLDFTVGLEVRPATTATLALALSALIGRPRLQAWLPWALRRLGAWRRPAP